MTGKREDRMTLTIKCHFPQCQQELKNRYRLQRKTRWLFNPHSKTESQTKRRLTLRNVHSLTKTASSLNNIYVHYTFLELFSSVCRVLAVRGRLRIFITSYLLCPLAVFFTLVSLPVHVPTSTRTSSSNRWLPAYFSLSCPC